MPGSTNLEPVSDLRMPAYKLAAGISVTQNIEPHQDTHSMMDRVKKSIVEVREALFIRTRLPRRVTASTFW